MANAAPKKNKTKALPTWDLTDLYPAIDSKEVKADVQKAQKLCTAFAKNYEGKVIKLSADELASAISEYEKIQELLGKLGSYAQLVYAEDMNSPQNGQFYQNISEQLTTIGSQILFFGLHLNKIPEAQLAEGLKTCKKLAHYAPWLREVRQSRPYQLSDDLEKLLLEKSVAGSAAWSRLFDETLAGLRFDYRGKKLSCEEVISLMSSPDEKARKDAAKAFGKVLGENNKTFSLIMNTLAKDKAIEDEWRGYKRPISSRNIANAVEDEVVEALLTAVKKSYPNLSHRYYKLKAKWFGKKKLEYWDRNAPLPKVPEQKYSWEEAKELVLSSYYAFSPEIGKIGQQFFDNNWIDVPARAGKASGAFAHPTVPSAHPYLLLNYLGRSRDVMTLAHELGHGVHQVLAAKQGALMADTPLTLAETASVFGEQLTFREMLKRTKSKAERKALIAGKVEDMLNTVVRQIAFCNFEIKLHDERRNGELTADRINALWLEVQKESLGNGIRFDKEYQYYWSYISHFIHSPFYVYAYAFGDCLVNSLYAVYEKNPKGFEAKYIEMLKAGGTLRHKELLAPFGLDASKPAFWQQGLDIIAGYIDQLEREDY
jgi:oligoendopeptidase F